MRKKEIQECIRSLALSLSVDSTSDRVVCPFCKGGSEHEKTFSVTRIPSGLLYNCFRASCNSGRGFIGSKDVVRDYNNKTKEFKPKLYRRPLYKLPRIASNWLRHKFRLTEQELINSGFSYDPIVQRIYMPITDVRGYIIGASSRSYTGDTPKTIAYWYIDHPKLYFPHGELFGNTAVLVEDIISAIRCKRLFGDSVALLGTGLNYEQVTHLRRYYNNVIYALDPDAVNKAVRMERKYRLLFNSSRVAYLSNDPKDMTDAKLWAEVTSGEKTHKCLYSK